jgi:hypothetical protein
MFDLIVVDHPGTVKRNKLRNKVNSFSRLGIRPKILLYNYGSGEIRYYLDY